MFNSIRGSMKHLMFEDDVPMDTKSLSGIVILTMYVCEIGEDSWIHVSTFFIHSTCILM